MLRWPRPTPRAHLLMLVLIVPACLSVFTVPVSPPVSAPPPALPEAPENPAPIRVASASPRALALVGQASVLGSLGWPALQASPQAQPQSAALAAADALGARDLARRSAVQASPEPSPLAPLALLALRLANRSPGRRSRPA